MTRVFMKDIYGLNRNKTATNGGVSRRISENYIHIHKLF